MKKLLLTFFAFLTWAAAYSQLTPVWCENFDGTISTTSSGNPGFTVDANYFQSPSNCIKGETVDIFGVSKLTSPVFSTTGQNFVLLEFDHICKINLLDIAKLEYSTDGVNWFYFDADPVKITQGGPGNCYYLGTSATFVANASTFTDMAHQVDWQGGFPVAPLNTWWKHETFDISLVAANQPTFQVRFSFEDQGGAMNGYYGWLIDNICVNSAPCEQFPPSVSLPYPGNIYFQGTIFTAPPYDIFAQIDDPSGILSAELYWTVNGGPVQQYGGMVQLLPDQWAGTISTGGIGDTICYWIEAIDNSGCLNDSTLYAANCIRPIGGLTPPFCDNFDIPNPNFASDPISIGTLWENGIPTGAALSTPHSSPNVWGIGNLNSAGDYVNNSLSYLTSAQIDFTSASVVNLEMYINYSTEETYDGMRIQYSTDNGATWNLLGAFNDPNATNWYNINSLDFTNIPAWSGLSSGWEFIKYKLASVPGIMGNPNVRMRFEFSSETIGTDEGFHIDDFCLSIPCNNDLGVSVINSPIDGSGTPSGTSNSITITLENYGVNPQSGFTIGYSVNGVAQTPVTYTGTLNGGLTASFTLPNYTVPSGGYDICVWTELAGDCQNSNDTICGTYVGIPTYTPSPSFCDDFDAGNNGWSQQNDPGAPATTIWELGLPNFGATTSTHSGANCWDINLNTQYDDDAISFLYSPYFDFSTIGSGRLDFWVNIAAENNYDGLRLEFSNDGGASWQVIGSANDVCGTNWYNDDQVFAGYFGGTDAWTGTSNGWMHVAYKLCCTTGIFNNPTPIQFRFAFASDGSVITSGVSVDDFCIYAAQGDDVGISDITLPVGGYPVGGTAPVVVVLENFGATTITSVPINYTVNGAGLQTIIWSGSLPPCGTVTVTLPSFTVVQGVNTIVAYTTLSTDQLHSNDSSTTEIIGQPLITPTYLNWYSDNFDAGNIGWAPFIEVGGDPGTQWEFGTPNFGQTTGAYSAPNSWDVNLNSAPNGSANCVLTTPYFDLTNAAGAIMRFWQNRNMNTFGDKFYIEYNINNTAWFKLLPPANYTTINWYNHASTFDYWDDISAGWIFSSLKDVTSLLGTPAPSLVQFRFVFISSAFSNAEGVSIDNFELFVPIPLSVKTVSVNTSVPCQFIFPGQPITFAAPIQNNGVFPVYVHNATLTIDGSIVSVDQVSYTPTPGSLESDSTIVHNFNNTWIAVPGFHQVCVYTDSPNGSLDLYQPDDTACATVLVFDSITTSQLPYCTSFESGNQWVTANSFSYCIQNDWQIGTPSKPNLNGAHTGNNAWSTNLTGTYANKDSSGLFSALIRVQENHCYKMSFYQQYRTEYGIDGGTLHYSTDYGVTWNRMNMTGTPNMQLFGASPNYTYVSELDPTDPASKGFTGTRNDWFYSEKVFRPDANSQAIIRWRFASDYSVVEEGWDIDDFCIEDLGTCAPIGIEEYAINNFGMSQNYPNPAEDLTTFDISIPAAGQVRVLISDILGQVVSVVADQNMDAGVHTFQVNTSGIAAGLYTYTMIYEGEQVSKRMVVTH